MIVVGIIKVLETLVDGILSKQQQYNSNKIRNTTINNVQFYTTPDYNENISDQSFVSGHKPVDRIIQLFMSFHLCKWSVILFYTNNNLSLLQKSKVITS